MVFKIPKTDFSAGVKEEYGLTTLNLREADKAINREYEYEIFPITRNFTLPPRETLEAFRRIRNVRHSNSLRE